MSGYEMVEEAEMVAALWHLLRRVTLIVVAIVAAGFAMGAVFEIAYLNASIWPALGWFALAHLLVSTERVLARAIHPEQPQSAPKREAKR